MGLLSRRQHTTYDVPNDSMAAFGFEQPRVLQQLQYSGVVEMVRIRRSAFPGLQLQTLPQVPGHCARQPLPERRKTNVSRSSRRRA